MQSVPPAPSPARPAPPPSGAPSGRAAPPSPLPRRFGRYQLFDRIGRGGMAEIYLARAANELGAERLVVVKQIHEALSRDEAFSRMFIDEAKLCAGLRHANVVQVLDLGREDGLLYMAMEYVEGFDLHQLLARCSRAKVPLPADFALFIVREVLAALDFAHRAADASGHPLGIVHRDVSPSNVLMSLEGEVKLCDFGIARAAGRAEGEAAGGTEDSRVVGKSAYMSPEHARGEALDARADVFAAGILLWELCAGRRLYRGTEEEMLAMARRGEIPPLPDRGLPEPERLQAILDRALATEREARYPSAAEMRAELDEYAISVRLFASQLRFGSFLMDHFGEAFVAERRARERAARALELGPPARIEPIAAPVAPAPDEATPAEAVTPRPALADVDTERTLRRDEDTVPEAPTLPAAPSPAPARATEAPRSAPLVAIALTVLVVLAVIAAAIAATR